MSDFFSMKMEDMHPLIINAFEQNGKFEFFPKGMSMYPTIVPEKDMVILIPPADIKRYDIVLYKRQNGKYILHRIIKLKKDSYIMSGDNQLSYEKGILPSQLIAKVKCIIKADGSVMECSGDINYNYSKALRRRLYPKHLVHSFKVWLYPFYRAIFRKNK